MQPSPNSLDGLPVWLQITISIVFGLTTLYIAVRTYTNREPAKALDNAQVIGAQIADTGAIRDLRDAVKSLDSNIVSLERAITESTHWRREGNELVRENCARLRRLAEQLERER